MGRVLNIIPISLELDSSRYFHAEPVRYPKPQVLYLPTIKETVPVFQGEFRITQDLATWDRDVIGTMPELENLRDGCGTRHVTTKSVIFPRFPSSGLSKSMMMPKCGEGLLDRSCRSRQNSNR